MSGNKLTVLCRSNKKQDCTGWGFLLQRALIYSTKYHRTMAGTALFHRKSHIVARLGHNQSYQGV